MSRESRAGALASSLQLSLSEREATMVMFLMAVCMSVFGLAVTALAFGAATRDEREAPAIQPALTPTLSVPVPAPRFFADSPILARTALAAAAATPQVPIEVLLLQLERHVRLEQAAAESFLEFPTSASLHSRTTSPLVH
jgi:hypothetical protein